MDGRGDGAEGPDRQEPLPEAMRDVLASIRALVSAETASRMGEGGAERVLMLTPEMRVDPPRAGELLADGVGHHGPAPGQPAPILDEEALRGVINAIVREELQGELGDRIARNLRRLIRRELGEVLEERNRTEEAPEA